MLHQQLKLTTTLTRRLTSATRRSVHPPTVRVLTYRLENVVLSVHHRKLSNQAMKNEEAPLKDLADLAHQERKVGQDQQVDQELLVLLDHNLTLLLYLDKSISKEEKKVPHQTLSPTCRRRSDLLDREDLQVCEVHPALKDLWDHRETMGTQDHPVLQDHRAFGVFLV